MKLRLLIIVPCMIVLLIACKKEKHGQFSYWEINGQEYSSNNTEVILGKAIGRLSCYDKNRFGITFYSFSFANSNSLPDFDSFLLVRDNRQQDPNQVLLYVYLDTVTYAPSTSVAHFLRAERSNKKVRYTLPSMWFINYFNPNDSVLIKGIFNEP